MKRNLLCAVFIAAVISAAAQDRPGHTPPQAVKAYANGNDSYLLFTNDTYKADRKYVVFKVWSQDAPISDDEQKELQELKGLLSQKGIEVVTAEWKTEADLKAVFKPFGIYVEAVNGKHIKLQNGNAYLNTTSPKALYVIENNKPISLCSGANCEDKLKYFFQLKALN